MTDRDPLDDLLQRSFDADRARQPPADMVTPVLRRIRRRQRARTLVLGGAAATGMMFTLASGVDLSALTSLLSGWRAGAASDTLLLVAGMLVALGGVLAIEESSA